MTLRSYIGIILLVATQTIAWSQGQNVPLGMDTYPLLDRLDIKTKPASEIHMAIKPYLRKDVAQYALSLTDSITINLSKTDRANLQYLLNDNNDWLATSKFSTSLTEKNRPIYQPVVVEGDTLYKKLDQQALASTEHESFEKSKPFLKWFYKTPAHFFETNHRFYYLKVSPIIRTTLGRSTEENQGIYNFQRGLELRGSIDDRLFFYTNILESQARYPDYVNRYIEQNLAIPGAGFYKGPEELWGVANSYDFLNAQGYVGFNVTPHIGLQFGHGTNFIGHGYRSLLLSDFANNYLHLKLNARFWKIHYQSIFGELMTIGTKDRPGDELLPRKYFAAHYLSIKNILPNLDVALFEATVFGRDEGFELQYLNPVILYRSIEGSIGSPDNVMIGFEAKWNFLRRFQLYGQLLFDEFKFDELLVERNGWWGNKLAYQTGLKYVDALGIPNLDAQVEYNLVRPFTYIHRDSVANYTHYKQALAHPLGANAKEWIVQLRYQPVQRLQVYGRLLRMTFGESTDGQNWGGDLLLSYNDRAQEYGNTVGQGTPAEVWLTGVDISYQFWHNMYVDFHYLRRTKDSADAQLDRTTSFFSGGLRMNIGQQRFDF